MAVFARGRTSGPMSGHTISAAAPIARPVTTFPPSRRSSTSAMYYLPDYQVPYLTIVGQALGPAAVLVLRSASCKPAVRATSDEQRGPAEIIPISSPQSSGRRAQLRPRQLREDRHLPLPT